MGIEFLKFLRLWPRRHTLERVITEFAAVMRAGDDAIMLADHRLVVHAACELTIGTVTVDFFAKQQLRQRLSEQSFKVLTIIHDGAKKCYPPFCGKSGKGRMEA